MGAKTAFRIKTTKGPMNNPIEKLEPLVTRPRDAEDITFSDIREYLYFLNEKINELIDAVNTLKKRGE